MQQRKRLINSSLFRNATIVMAATFLLSAATDVMAWQRNISRTGPRGNTASRNITGTRTANGYTRNSTVTGPGGATASRSAQGQYDPATKTWTKNVNATGPNGQTATRNTTATRTDNGYTASTTVTGPNGNSATRSSQGQWDPTTKTWTKSVSTTGSGQ